jgi:tripartite-type tricarboxylate transporter receptor subunit TctC
MVGFPAGSSLDFVARVLAEYLKDYAPSMIVDNRPGAGGRLPLAALKGGVHDGSLMVLTPGDQVALFPHVYAKLGYDGLRDFAPVSTVCMVQFLWMVGPLVPPQVKTLADFIAWCRSNPKSATYASPGEGTRPHFMSASLARSAGVEMIHVPYKGGPLIVQDLLAGQIAASLNVPSNVLPQIQSGKLRALATTAPKRASLLPDVPTAREAGYPALEGVEWFGLFVPAGTSPEIVSSLNSAVREALDTDAVKTKLAEQSYEPRGCTPAEFAQLIKSDLERWAATVKAFGFTPMD